MPCSFQNDCHFMREFSRALAVPMFGFRPKCSVNQRGEKTKQCHHKKRKKTGTLRSGFMF